MLSDAIRLASQLYRCDPTLRKSNERYEVFLDSMGWGHDIRTDGIDGSEVRNIRRFVNSQWNARMRATVEDMQGAFNEILPRISDLQSDKLIDLCLDKTEEGRRNTNLIGHCFQRLATCSGSKHNEATAASKVLHLIYPDLFVMWDRAIRWGYGGYKFILYTDFLRKMQRIVYCVTEEEARQTRLPHGESFLTSLPSGARVLLKTLDEYNYMKFTKNCDLVWKKEYELTFPISTLQGLPQSATELPDVAE